MTKVFDVRINNLAYGGDGLGKLTDGRVVFVPYAIPGELVRLRLVEEKLHYARAEILQVQEASPGRLTPRCQHYTTCGGCHYQHMDYPSQLRVKATILGEQLERIGGLKEIPIVEIEAAPEPWYYRNHIQFHLTREGKLGFQKAHSNQTFPILECHLPENSINRLWPLIEFEPDLGVERVSLRTGKDDEMMLILESSNPEPLDFSIEDLAISVVQVGQSGSLVLAGSDHILMEISERYFKVSARSFFQVHTLQAKAMVRQLLTYLSFDKDMTILDVYCGVGLFSAFLAPKVKNLVGIEMSPESCADFAANLDEFDNVSLYEDTSENVLNSVNFDPDIIIMDPPREGLGEKTVNGILAQGAATLVYVSCDPATMARDAKRLISGGYKLEKITLFDMFPQTYHIESITYWGRT